MGRPTSHYHSRIGQVCFGAIRGAKGTSGGAPGIVGRSAGGGNRWMAAVRIPLMPNVNPRGDYIPE